MDGIIFISEIDPKDFDGKVREVSEYLLKTNVALRVSYVTYLVKRFCKNISPKQKGFDYHLKAYSKNRRKHQSIGRSRQLLEHSRLGLLSPNKSANTLHLCNDFVEPNIEHIQQDLVALRNKSLAIERKKPD